MLLLLACLHCCFHTRISADGINQCASVCELHVLPAPCSPVYDSLTVPQSLVMSEGGAVRDRAAYRQVHSLCGPQPPQHSSDYPVLAPLVPELMLRRLRECRESHTPQQPGREYTQRAEQSRAAMQGGDALVTAGTGMGSWAGTLPLLASHYPLSRRLPLSSTPSLTSPS